MRHFTFALPSLTLRAGIATAVVTLVFMVGLLAFTNSAQAAAPTMTALAQDVDGNGTVDRITITFSEAVDIDDGGAGDGLTSIALGNGCTIPNADYGNDSTTTLAISSLTGCTAGNTALTPSVTYTAVANCTTAMSICDAANANQMANAQTTNATDGAPPQILTFTYQDVDVDGKIDTILITYTESTNSSSVLKASHLSLTTAGDFTGAAFGSATTDVADGGTTDTVTLGTEATPVDTAEGLGTIAISSIVGDGTMSLSDSITTNTAAKAQTQATFADGAAPQIKTLAYQDADFDGKIDTFAIGYSESTSAASVLSAAELSLTSVGDFTAAAFGSSTTDIADGGTSDTITLGTEATVIDTAQGAAMNLSTTTAVDNLFSLTDGTNNNVTEKAEAQVTFSDGAAPQISSFTYLDVDLDGKIDSFTVAYSESTTSSSVLSAAELSLTAVGDFTAAAFGSSTTDIADGGTTDTVTLGTEASAVDTFQGAAMTISTVTAVDNLFSLTDGTNNNVTEKAEAQVSFADGAGPLLTASSPASAAASVAKTATITLTFSEPISSISASLSPSSTITNGTSLPASTVVFTSTSKVSGTNTLTVATAPDATSNAYVGAASTAVSPFSFTVVSSSSSSSSSSSTTSSGTTYGLTLNSHNTDSTSVTTGESSTITWGSTGSAMTYVNIYLSVDGGTTWSTIATNTANDGSYVWTVPDTETTEAMIRIDGTDLATVLATDSSDGMFVITDIETPNDDSIITDDSTDSETDAPASTGETGVSPVTGEIESISVVEAGDYIRGAYFDTVYYIDADLVRHPFIDRQTFFTYASNFDGVHNVTDATLTTLTLGSPMLPKAGVVLVKIQSDNKVYWVEGDVMGGMWLRWVTSEGVANEMFGANWADYVIDISSAIFPKYEGRGADIETAFEIDADDLRTRDEVNTAE